MLIQQGDVLIELVESIPKRAYLVKPTKGRHILAEGEATGHAHVIVDEELEMFEEYDVLYMNVPKEATVTHEEHKPIAVPPGQYRVRKVREYDHFAKESRLVRD